MAAVAPTQRHSPTNNTYRHQPYASTSSSSSAPAASSSTNPRISSNSTSKWQQSTQHQQSNLPPSPPRSRRDNSETPSAMGLGVAFGGNAGGKWWDEELPAPPASLSSILDSFRRSGEGDRDLLLAILGAKKAEEERLTSLIQTRLTVLQARLSLHSAAAAVAQTQSQINSPFPGAPPSLVESSHLSPGAQSNHLHLHPNPGHGHGSSRSQHRGSNASSPNSPPLMTPIDESPSSTFPNTVSGGSGSGSGSAKKPSGSYWQHPSTSNRDREEEYAQRGRAGPRGPHSDRSRSRSPQRRIIRDERDRLAVPGSSMNMTTPSFSISQRLDRQSLSQSGSVSGSGSGLLPHPPILNRARSHSNTTPSSAASRPTLSVSLAGSGDATADKMPATRNGGSVSPKTSDERGRAANGLDMLLDAGMGRSV